MIRLNNVSYAYPHGKTAIANLTIELPTHRRMAVLGAQDSGKTTLIGLLSGIIDPTAGRIERFAHLSFPAGYNRAFRFSNSVRQNLVFAARIYDADIDQVVDFVSGLLGIADQLDQPMRSMPVPTRLALAYALTYALPFDTYLFDNVIGPGDLATRDLWKQLYDARTATAGAIIATRQPRVVEAYCDCALVLRRDGDAVFCDSVREALALFEQDNASAAAARAQAEPQVVDPVAAAIATGTAVPGTVMKASE